MPFAKIIVTNSTTTGAQPNPLDLSIGELSLNAADGKLFALDDSNNLVKLSDKTYESRISYLETNPGVWGSISGTLSNQTDLNNELNAKVNTTDLTNAVFNTSSVGGGAKITLEPSFGTDASFDIVHSGAGLNVTTANDIVTIIHTDTTRVDTAGVVSGVFGDTLDVITGVTSNAKGHITGVETSTLTLPNVQSLEDRLDALEYVPIDISSFTVSPSTTLYEFAGNAATYDLDFSWSTNTTPDTITLTSDFSSPTFTGADTTYDEPAFSVTNSTGAEVSHTWTLGVTDYQSSSDSSSKTIRWVYPFFYGEDTTDLSGGTGIENLTKNVSRKGDKTFGINATNEFIYFAYPASYGDLSIILDGNGFNVTSSFTKHTANVTPPVSGVARSYNIYKSNSVTTINQNFQFKF
jgi:hypothetical protein